MLTFDELLEVLLEDGETVTVEDYDDFFIIETTFEEEQKMFTHNFMLGYILGCFMQSIALLLFYHKNT